MFCPGDHKWNSKRGFAQMFELSTRHILRYHANTPMPVIGGVSPKELDILHSVETATLREFVSVRVRLSFCARVCYFWWFWCVSISGDVSAKKLGVVLCVETAA